jgi:FkbM family methyltransferase
MSGARTLQLGPNRVLVAARDGWLIANPNDGFIGAALLRYGEYQREESDLLVQLVRPGAVVVEGGANIGAHTLALARAVGPAGRVMAFEPQPSAYHQVCAVAALNGFGQIEARRQGLGAAAAELRINTVDDPASIHNGGRHALCATGAGAAVDVVRLDDVFAAPGAPHRLDLIKLDIEGMEAAALAGAQDVIARFRPALYVENDRPELSQALIRQIWSYDYQLWWHLPSMFAADNFFGAAENIYEGMVSANMLALPKRGDHNVSGLLMVEDAGFHPVFGQV